MPVSGAKYVTSVYKMLNLKKISTTVNICSLSVCENMWNRQVGQ